MTFVGENMLFAEYSGVLIKHCVVSKVLWETKTNYENTFIKIYPDSFGLYNDDHFL